MATDSKRIAKNTLFLYFRMFISLAISLATAGVTLRVLGKVDYGLNAVLGGVVAMFSFLNGSLASAASRNITFEIGRGDWDRVNRIFNVSLVVFLGLAAVVVLLSETVGMWFFYNKMVIPPERLKVAFWVLQLSILGVPLSLSQVPYSAVLVAHENMKIYAYTSIADQVARLAMIYLLIVSPFDKLLTLAAMGFLWSTAMLIFYRVYCIRRYAETRLRFCRDKALYKSIVQYAGSDLIGNLSCLAQGQGFNLLLNTFFGPVVNAARGIAYGLQGMTTQFSGNFMVAVEPQITKSFAQSDLEGLWKLVKRCSCFSYYLVWLLALPALLEGDFVLRLWLGDYPEHTLSFFYLIMVVCLLQTLKTPIVKVYHANGKILWGNISCGTILCLSFPVAYVCLRYGCAPESVFWCTIGSMVICNIIDWFNVNYYVKFDILAYVRAVYGRCALVTIASSIIPYLVYDRILPPSILRMMLTGILTTISVGLSALYLGMSAPDRARLFELARQKFNTIFKRP